MPKNISIKFNKRETNKSQLVRLPLFNILITAVVINVILILLVILFRNKIPPEVPLFYGAPKGEEQLTANTNLILPSLFSISIIIVNSSIALLLNNDFLKKVLIASVLVVNLMTIVTITKIVLLVGGF